MLDVHSSEKICIQIGHRYACDSQVSSCIAMQHRLVLLAATVWVAREIRRCLLMLMTCALDYASCLPPRILRSSWPYIQRLVYRSICAAKHHRVYAVIVTISYVSIRPGSALSVRGGSLRRGCTCTRPTSQRSVVVGHHDASKTTCILCVSTYMYPRNVPRGL